MNENLKELALEVGGSHYPEVSKPYLELTVKLVIEEIAKLTPVDVDMLKKHWGIN